MIYYTIGFTINDFVLRLPLRFLQLTINDFVLHLPLRFLQLGLTHDGPHVAYSCNLDWRMMAHMWRARLWRCVYRAALAATMSAQRHAITQALRPMWGRPICLSIGFVNHFALWVCNSSHPIMIYNSMQLVAYHDLTPTGLQHGQF